MLMKRVGFMGLCVVATMAAYSSPDEDSSEKEVIELEYVELGEEYESGEFTIAIIDAKIDNYYMRGLFRELVKKERALVLTFRFANKSERKIHRFSEGSSERFSLYDDVMNEFRRRRSGMNTTIEGALERSTVFNPKDEESHVVIFEIPPPKTEFLVLVLNMKAFGLDGVALFHIPAEQIVGFHAN